MSSVLLTSFFFSKYLEGDSKGETIFRCMEKYLQEQNISLENITAVATGDATAMVSRYRGSLPCSNKRFHMW